MKRLIFLFLITGLFGCGQSSTPHSGTSIAAATSAPAKPAPKIVRGEERKQIVAPLTEGLNVERDKMEQVTFYSSKGLPRQTPTLDAYIGLPDEKMPYLMMRSIYSGERWVFYNQVKIMADDVIVYDRQFGHRDVQHNNSGGHVWETADFPAEATELAALRAIANSKSATIRFTGRDKREDHELTTRERKDLQQVLSTYEQMTAQLQVPAA